MKKQLFRLASFEEDFIIEIEKLQLITWTTPEGDASCDMTELLFTFLFSN